MFIIKTEMCCLDREDLRKSPSNYLYIYRLTINRFRNRFRNVLSVSKLYAFIIQGVQGCSKSKDIFSYEHCISKYTFEISNKTQWKLFKAKKILDYVLIRRSGI